MSWTPPTRDPEVELRDALTTEKWREPITQIAERHELDSRELFPFPTGSDVVWSAGEHVIKFTEPRWAEQMATEAENLKLVHGALVVGTPRLALVGELEGWPYLVMTHVAGEPIGDLWPSLAGEDRRRLAGDLGRLTKQLHALAGEEQATAWPSFWSECLHEVPERHARRGAPPELAREIAPFLGRVGPLTPSGFGFLHTELLHVHILAEQRAGHVELCGLIDFADSRVGAVEYEFAAPAEFLFKTEPGALRAFLLGYGEDPDQLDAERSRRLLAWSLCHQFGHLERMLVACGQARPTSLDDLAEKLFGLEA